MDRRARVYYKVNFDTCSKDMRVGYLKCINGVKVRYRKKELLVGCPINAAESVEYALRKAERRDGYCEWERV